MPSNEMHVHGVVGGADRRAVGRSPADHREHAAARGDQRAVALGHAGEPHRRRRTLGPTRSSPAISCPAVEVAWDIRPTASTTPAATSLENRARAGSGAPVAAASSSADSGSSRSGSTTCASGSPKRQLNSITFGPIGRSASTRSRGSPRNGVPSAAIAGKHRPHDLASRSAPPARRRPARSARTRPSRRCWGPGRRRAAACGPAPIRSATKRSPSAITKYESSSPTRHSSSTTRARRRAPKAPSTIAARSAASASTPSRAITTPLPPARPSAFTTTGTPSSPRAHGCQRLVERVADPTRAPSARRRAPSRPSRTPCSSPAERQRASARTTGRPAARKRSATPAASGASGPTTVRSARHDVGEREHGVRIGRQRPAPPADRGRCPDCPVRTPP